MNTQLNRKPDWRTLNLDYSVRPRRCHSRHIYGPLIPMDEPEAWHWSAKLIVIGGAFLAAYVILNGGKF